MTGTDAVSRIESLLAAKNAEATVVWKSAWRTENASERAERLADYRQLLDEANGLRQALDAITGGQS